MKTSIIILILVISCCTVAAAEAKAKEVEANGSAEAIPVDYTTTSGTDGRNIWPWLLTIALVGVQILVATKGPAFDWPDLFRFLGTLSFAAVAMGIGNFASLLAYESERAPSLPSMFAILLAPFIGFIGCYLIAHLLETFNMIKENTDRLCTDD